MPTYHIIGSAGSKGYAAKTGRLPNESLSGTLVFTVNGFAASALFGIGNGPSSSLDAYFPVANQQRSA